MTGAGRGLGREYAMLLAARGARVVVTGGRRQAGGAGCGRERPALPAEATPSCGWSRGRRRTAPLPPSSQRS
ncbi:hypothetical protein [Streptomyces goshikiensis]|uniref:hypothetical protein n=1 Tax=Streptomyces goshikiensis TaxID=1942 RepID=UPI00365CC8C4